MSDILEHEGWRLARGVEMPGVGCFRLEYRKENMWCHITLPYPTLTAAMERDRVSSKPWLANEIMRHLDDAARHEAERQSALEYARMC